MSSKTILLTLNPGFDKRQKCGVSRLYQIFCAQYGYNLKIVDVEFLKNNIPKEKYSEVLVIAGGDGTIHYVLNVIPEEALDKYIFGIIPAGTANEYAKSLFIPRNLEDAARIIASPKVISYSYLGVVNNKYRFVSGLLYGLADYAVKITPQEAKNSLGMVAFHYGVFKLLLSLLFKHKKFHKIFEFNDKKVCTNFILINNLSLSSKDLSSLKVPEDENIYRFTLIYFKKYLEIPHIIGLLFRNRMYTNILSDPLIHYSQHENISIKINEKIEMLVDGEPYSFDDKIEVRRFDKSIAVIIG